MFLDFIFQDKDSYGNEIILMARPMPIEYVLIEVSIQLIISEYVLKFYEVKGS